MRLTAGLIIAGIIAAIALGGWTAGGDEREAPIGSRVAILYQNDPLLRTISLATGKAGHAFSGNDVGNSQSDLDFGNYHEGCLTVGIEGGRIGTILDLGSVKEMAKRYGYDETVGGGQGYASIRIADGRIVIRTGHGREEHQDMRENRILTRDGESCAHARVELGHIYLVRLVGRHEPGFERIAKLQVIGHRPDDSVTIRWDILRNEPERRRR